MENTVDNLNDRKDWDIIWPAKDVVLLNDLAVVPENGLSFHSTALTTGSSHHQLRHLFVRSSLHRGSLHQIRSKPAVPWATGSVPAHCISVISDPENFYYMDGLGYGHILSRVNLTTGKHQRFGQQGAHYLCSSHGFVASVGYRSLQIYDETLPMIASAMITAGDETAAENQVPPESDDADAVPLPRLVFDESVNELSGQKNSVSITNCQGRLVVLVAANGGGVAMYELQGSYTLGGPDEYPHGLEGKPEFKSVAHYTDFINFNSAEMDPTGRFIISGCDHQPGPVVLEVKHLGDSQWDISKVRGEGEDPTDLVLWFQAQPTEFGIVRRVETNNSYEPHPELPDFKDEDISRTMFVTRPTHTKPNPDAPTRRRRPQFGFNGDDSDGEREQFNTAEEDVPPLELEASRRGAVSMDSIHSAWCSWAENLVACVTEQGMCFLWDWKTKQILSCWSTLDVSAYARTRQWFYYRHFESARLVRFSPSPNVPILVFADSDSNIFIVDLRTYKHQVIHIEEISGINGIEFSKDLTKLYVAAPDRVVEIKLITRNSLVDLCLAYVARNKKNWESFKWEIELLPSDVMERLERFM